MIQTTHRHIHFTPMSVVKGGLLAYSCHNGTCKIGIIDLFAATGKFVFTPTASAIYSPAQLREIADFVEALEGERKTGR